jgi:hypothetical protein
MCLEPALGEDMSQWPRNKDSFLGPNLSILLVPVPYKLVFPL